MFVQTSMLVDYEIAKKQHKIDLHYTRERPIQRQSLQVSLFLVFVRSRGHDLQQNPKL